MPVEIEAKLKVDNLNAVRDKLKASGATPLGAHFEVNMFFDTEDRSLQVADQGLRIRTARDNTTGAEKHTITFKGPQQKGTFKNREEIEIVVDDFAQAKTLLERLGMHKVLSFEKRRESWRIGDCTVELDEVPFLGFFVEIEGPTEEAVAKMRKELGLDDRFVMKASYISLLIGHLQEHGKSQRVIRFPKGVGKSATE